jgi:hypothetical protein
MFDWLFGKHNDAPYRTSKVDRLLKDILQGSVVRGVFEPSTRELEELVDLIQRLCNSLDMPGWHDTLGIDYYIGKLVPYGPPLILPLPLTTVIYWNPHIGGVEQHFKLEIVLAHIIDRYKPASCQIVDTLLGLDDFGETLQNHLRKLELFNSKDVLDQTKARIVNTLCTLAWPVLREWPDKSSEITEWAEDEMSGLSKKLGSISRYTLSVCIPKLRMAQRDMANNGTCSSIYLR